VGLLPLEFCKCEQTRHLLVKIQWPTPTCYMVHGLGPVEGARGAKPPPRGGGLERQYLGFLRPRPPLNLHMAGARPDVLLLVLPALPPA
jgi:hypothetical protein